MGKLLVFNAPRQCAYETTEEVALRPDEIRIRTLFSGLSAGTEMTYYRGTNPYLNKQWNPATKMFLPDQQPTFQYPVRNLGYEEVGQVIEVGAEITDIAPGATVFGTWGHRTHHIAPISYVRPRLMPDGLDPILGIFSHIGAIALNGIHDGCIRIGETVAVFGLGVLGQIVAQAARQSGAQVIAVDLHDRRLEMAKSLGAHHILNASRDQPAEAIKELTGGRGADVCFEVSGSTQALHEAIRAVAYSARVVAMGFFQGEAKGLFLGEEFHHNRINLVCSQISGPGPELSYRWDKLRLWQTAIQLQARNLLNLRPLITHTTSFENAQTLYELLDQSPEQVMQAVIEFPKE